LNERDAMARALDLAGRGWGRVQPNPLVGAIVLADGEIIAEGYHAEFGGPHAEAAALSAAGHRARGATLVVTLEPCAHQGKQPPCVDQVIAAGVRRVVAAIRDPNPVAAGGAERLRAAGIDVEFGVLAREASALNAPFLHRARGEVRPFVALKLATSVDARIADRDRRSRWISGPEARDYVHWLRAGFDAIGVGGATARHDDPSLTVRGPLTPRIAPRRVVFAPALNLRLEAELIRSAREVPTTVVAGADAFQWEMGRALAAAGVELVPAESLEEALTALAERGVGSLLVEGGGRLAGGLLRAELVARLHWVQSPLWLGERGVPAFSGLPSLPLASVERWHPVERRALGDDTLLVLDRTCSPD
jgi:diaminohydroxyphosphoribosylaminopyrimidine deaminase/5-amino-6-(5-phosphoribosylamino)uracil reductase